MAIRFQSFVQLLFSKFPWTCNTLRLKNGMPSSLSWKMLWIRRPVCRFSSVFSYVVSTSMWIRGLCAYRLIYRSLSGMAEARVLRNSIPRRASCISMKCHEGSLSLWIGRLLVTQAKIRQLNTIQTLFSKISTLFCCASLMVWWKVMCIKKNFQSTRALVAGNVCCGARWKKSLMVTLWGLCFIRRVNTRFVHRDVSCNRRSVTCFAFQFSLVRSTENGQWFLRL